MEAFYVICVVSVITMFTRAFPFLLFGGKKEIPSIITTLGKLLPPAIMGILVVYCVKGVTLFSYPYGLPEWISIVVTVILHLWKRNVLFSIALGTICYMVCIQAIF